MRPFVGTSSGRRLYCRVPGRLPSLLRRSQRASLCDGGTNAVHVRIRLSVCSIEGCFDSLKSLHIGHAEEEKNLGFAMSDTVKHRCLQTQGEVWTAVVLRHCTRKQSVRRSKRVATQVCATVQWATFSGQIFTPCCDSSLCNSTVDNILRADFYTHVLFSVLGVTTPVIAQPLTVCFFGRASPARPRLSPALATKVSARRKARWCPTSPSPPMEASWCVLSYAPFLYDFFSV